VLADELTKPFFASLDMAAQTRKASGVHDVGAGRARRVPRTTAA
jgi:hypothetical protein